MLELREQVLDGVAGLVEMDIEGGWIFPARMGRNDCLCSNCSDLVSAGLPVLGTITENSPGIPAHQQASKLLALVRLAWCQHKIHGIALGIPHQVDFGREAAPRAPKGLNVGPPFCTSRMLLGSNDGAVNHDPFTTRLTSNGFEDPLPDTTPVPPIEAGEDRVPGPKGFWQIPPGGTSSVLPENGFNDGAILQTRVPNSALFARQQRLHPRPHPFSQEGSCHALPQRNTQEVPQLGGLYNPIRPFGFLDSENRP